MAKQEKTKTQILKELKKYQEEYRKQAQIIEGEHRLALEAIGEAEAKYQYLYNKSPAICLIIGMDFEVQDANRKALEILAYAKEDLIGKPFLEMVVIEQREAVFLKLEENFQNQSTTEIECDLIDNQKKSHTILFSHGHPMSYQEKQIESILITGMDITEKKKKEREKDTIITMFVEHVKHLNCLYEVSKVVALPNISKNDFLKKMIDLIPSAFQVSNKICVQIKIKQKVYQSPNFQKTKWKLSVPFEIQSDQSGEIAVYYKEERPIQDIGPFFIEEKHLLEAIGERISHFLKLKAINDKLRIHQDQLKKLVDNRTRELVNTNQQLQNKIEEGKRREALIAKQAEDILELSTPVLQIIKGVLVVPLIGMLDSHRTQHFMETLLCAIVNTGSRVAMIDITSVPTIDTQTAQHLVETTNAIKLLGAQVILTGVRPAIAQTLVHLGIDLSHVQTQASITQGLFSAMKILGYQVQKLERESQTAIGRIS